MVYLLLWRQHAIHYLDLEHQGVETGDSDKLEESNKDDKVGQGREYFVYCVWNIEVAVLEGRGNDSVVRYGNVEEKVQHKQVHKEWGWEESAVVRQKWTHFCRLCFRLLIVG